jgi:hypothetical protein
MPIGATLKTIFSNGASKLVDSVATGLDSLITNKEERAAAQLAIQKEVNRAIEVMEAQANDLEKAYLADVGNARDMQKAALAQTDTFSKRYIYYFSTFWSVFAAGYLAGITFLEYPEKNTRIVDTVLGFLLGTAIAAIFNFFYGTTNNSKTRNDQVYSAITEKLKH